MASTIDLGDDRLYSELYAALTGHLGRRHAGKKEEGCRIPQEEEERKKEEEVASTGSGPGQGPLTDSP
jgi:hypothetical protein